MVNPCFTLPRIEKNHILKNRSMLCKVDNFSLLGFGLRVQLRYSCRGRNKEQQPTPDTCCSNKVALERDESIGKR